MKAFWNNVTLMGHASDEDNGHIPWYAWPLAALFVAGWLGADLILTASGF